MNVPTRTAAAAIRGRSLLIGSVTFIALLCVGTARGQASLGEVVGTWGGVVNCVYVQQDVDPWTAYVGSGRRLVILNVQDPANIVELGSIDLGNMVIDVTVRGGYAFVSTFFQPNPLCVVDVSDPAAPHLVWYLTSPSRFFGDKVVLHGNVLYAVCAVGSAKRVYGFDVTNPASPVSHGILLDYASYPAQGFGVSGDLMYVASSPPMPPYLYVFDLAANPYAPALLGSVQLTSPPCWDMPLSLVVEGDYVCITTQREYALAVVNVSNPAAPVVAGYYSSDFASLPRIGALSGGLAYITDGHLKLLDVGRDPAAPQLVSTVTTHGSISGVAVFGTRAYVMDEGEGLIVYDVAGGKRGEPVRLGNWHSPADLRKLAKAGNLLYVTDCWNGITILNVASPREPALVGVYQAGEGSERWGDNWGIAVRDEKAYLSAGLSGVEVVNVADPAQPTMVGAYRFSAGLSAQAMTLDGDIAYVGVRPGVGGYMVNFNISDPAYIMDVGLVALTSVPLAIQVTDGIAALARDGIGGMLTVVDTADATSPFVLADGIVGGFDLVRNGAIVYLANDDTYGGSSTTDGGLRIMDVSDPANPMGVGHFVAERASAVAARSNMVYLTATYGGKRQVLAFDVADPAAPVLVAETTVPGAAHALLVDGRYAYVTGGYGTNAAVGLTIIEMSVARGDLNCDGALNVFDIDPFVLALTDEAGYGAAFTGCDRMAADCNGDGLVNTFDIDPFVILLTGKGGALPTIASGAGTNGK